MQVFLKGSYTPVAATNQQVDAVTTEDVVQVSVAMQSAMQFIYLLVSYS